MAHRAGLFINLLAKYDFVPNEASQTKRTFKRKIAFEA
jgi:hypothetical protein